MGKIPWAKRSYFNRNPCSLEFTHADVAPYSSFKMQIRRAEQYNVFSLKLTSLSKQCYMYNRHYFLTEFHLISIM